VQTDKDPGTLQCTGVQEQRVSGLAIHSLIGAAIIFNRDLLRQIPTAGELAAHTCMSVCIDMTRDNGGGYMMSHILNRESYRYK
jgi:hypothetical protein